MPPHRKTPTTDNTSPPRRASASDDVNAIIARVTPDVLTLLGDGMPRTRGVILAALAERHPRDDIKRTLMRLAVTEQLVEKGGKHTVPAPETE